MTTATKRKDRPEGLAEDKYFNLIEHAADGIAIIQDGVFKLVNTALTHISGYNKEELLGMPFTELLTPASQKLTMERYQARLAGKKVPQTYEVQAVTKDGQIRDIELNAVLTEYNGRVADEAIVRDITERKQAEEKIKKTEQEKTDILNSMAEIVIFQDLKHHMLWVNKIASESAGLTHEQMLGRHCYEIWSQRNKPCVGCPVEKARQTGKPQKAEIATPDGRLWSIRGYPMRDENGVITGMLEVVLSLTERKKAEKAIRQSEEKYRNLYELAPYAIVTVDRKGVITSCNAATLRYTGYSEDEIVGKHFSKLGFNKPSDIPRYMKIFNSLLKGKLPEPFEVNYTAKDGANRWLQARVGFLGTTGSKKGFQIALEDITERKKAEEALQTERNKLQSVIDAMEDSLTIQDKEYNIIYQNEPSIISSGGSRIGEKCYRVYEGRDKVCDGCPVEKAFKDGKSHTTERQRLLPSGEVAFYENTANPIRDASGKIVSCLEVGRNITERKKTEQALADEATRRRILVDQSRDGIVVLDENGKVYEANQQFAEMLGYTPEETAQLYVFDWEYLYPPEKVLEMVRTVDEAGDHFETKHRRKDGSTYDVEISTNGTVIAGQKLIFCVCRDITERKQAEKALQESNQRFTDIAENALEWIWEVDTKGKYIYASPIVEQILGYKPEEVVGKHFYDLFHPDDSEEVKKAAFQAFAEKQPFRQFLNRCIHKNGQIVWLSTSGVPILGEEGNLLGFRGADVDITERRQAEEALRESEERYRTVIEGAHDMIQSVALDGSVNFVNKAWLDTLGYTKADLPGLNLSKVIHPDSLPHCRELFAKVVEGEPANNLQATFLTKDGREILVEGNAAPRYIGDKVVATQGIFRDITERKNMEQQLQEKNEELDSQNEELKAINEELQATEEELQHSQERLERMFESATDGIVVTNLDGTVLKVNERAAQMIGYASADELLGKNCLDCVTPGDHQKMANNMQKVIKEGLIKRQEYTMRKADGTEFPAELSTNIIKDASGNAIGLITIARDITERKQMEQLFKTVTNSSQVGIYIIQDKKFQMANPRFQELTGYSEEELIGMDSLALVLPEDRDTVKEEAIKMIKGERSSPYQFRVVNKAGETRWVMETVSSIPYRGRQATLGNYMDITERRQAEEREDQLQQELNLAGRLASIGQLAAGVAHEINNPLTGVIGFSHLMLSRDIPADMKQDLQVIHSEAQRVAKIVENLLVFAHQRKTGREYVAINDIITRVLELRAYEMKVNNIEVEKQLDPELPLTMADAGQFQQVFLNIILNAEYFMTKAHNKGTLLVKTEKINGNIRASFTDDGAGISKENLDKIFNPFFTTKEVGKGTGLGLSICHGIITQHKGRIFAQSELGKGATFVIELPILAEPAPTGKTEEIKKEPEKPRGAKILVVDDEAAILTFLNRLLTGWGHSVETINNADTALERLRTERYSLVLLDIKLPGMSGIELYHHIKEIAPALARRVMFITGDVMEGATRSFLEETGAPYITKPLDIEVLKKTINRALNRTQATPATSG
jgi:PAS domain S-box-containing protein